jgi:hypothetical protein
LDRSAPPGPVRAQLAGVAPATFAMGPATAVLSHGGSASGYLLTFVHTGQRLAIRADLGNHFLLNGATTALLQFELVDATPDGNLVTRATLVLPTATSLGTAALRAGMADAAATLDPAGSLANSGAFQGEVTTFSGAAQQLAGLAKLEPLDGTAWTSIRSQLATGADLHSAEAAQDAFVHGLRQLLPSLGIGFERALARLVMGAADNLPAVLAPYAQSRVRPPANAAPGSAAPDDSALANFSAQQLSASEQSTAHWQGDAWPGTPAKVDIGRWQEQQADTGAMRHALKDLLPADVQPLAWLRLQISPPTLGPLEIFAAHLPGHGAWARIRADNPATINQLGRLQDAFSAQLAEARVRLDLQSVAGEAGEKIGQRNETGVR